MTSINWNTKGIARIGNHSKAITRTADKIKFLRLPMRSEIIGANKLINIMAKLGKLDR